MKPMSYEIITIPCLEDNYVFIIANTATGEAAIIDAPVAAPINAAFAARPDLKLTTVLLTHHHWDHVDGVPGLDGASDLTIIGCAADEARLPILTKGVTAGDEIKVCGLKVNVMLAEGHTLNHIAFYVPEISAVFTGDSLMTHGCGRLFEGTPAQMQAAMQGFAALPDETRSYCGHNYADANMAFAKLYAPDELALQQRLSELNTKRAAQESTTGVTLALEKKLNPYLRVHLPEVKACLNMAGADDDVVFAEIRARKDKF
jgi:hydroxyacylglutathione hydrolase